MTANRCASVVELTVPKLVEAKKREVLSYQNKEQVNRHG